MRQKEWNADKQAVDVMAVRRRFSLKDAKPAAILGSNERRRSTHVTKSSELVRRPMNFPLGRA